MGIEYDQHQLKEFIKELIKFDTIIITQIPKKKSFFQYFSKTEPVKSWKREQLNYSLRTRALLLDLLKNLLINKNVDDLDKNLLNNIRREVLYYNDNPVSKICEKAGIADQLPMLELGLLEEFSN